MKYIDADKLIAEIERRREKCADIAADEKNEEVAEYYRGKEVAYDETSSLIASLQQEQPEGGCSEKPNDLSLPSNMDEAAHEFEDKAMSDYDYISVTENGIKRPVLKYSFTDAFKAGARWMAGIGVSMLGRVGIYGVDVESITKELREAGFNLGEEIILQIRKKQ